MTSTEHAQKFSVEIVNYHLLHLYKVLRFVLCRKRIWHILVAFWPCLYYSYSASQAYVSERHNARSSFRTVSSVLLDSMQLCSRGIVTLPLACTRPTTQSARAVPQPAMESQSVSTSLGMHRVIPLIYNLQRLLELPQVTPSVHVHRVYTSWMLRIVGERECAYFSISHSTVVLWENRPVDTTRLARSRSPIIYTTHRAMIGKHDVSYCISEGSDYTLSGNQTIWRTDSGGEWNSEYCLQVILLCDDQIPENNESATIIISSTTSHVILTQESFTLVIIDNDCKRHLFYKLF